MTYTYTYPHPAVTADIVVFSVEDDRLKILLIRRKEAPFQGQWALPGGFVGIDESIDDCALRELQEETGLSGIYLEQLYTFGAPDRDPRERVISVAYFALTPMTGLTLKHGSDAMDAQWHNIDALPELAFDHGAIIRLARERLTAKLDYSTVGLKFMPTEFTLSDVQSLYETVSGQARDKRNFRKWILSLEILEETGRKKTDGAHRPAMLYTLKSPAEIRMFK